MRLQKRTELIDAKVKFKKWCAGHWHTAGAIDEEHILIYDKLTALI